MGKEVYKKVFLENLPKDKKGRILWVETIGHKVRFVYDDIDDYVLILEVKERNMLVLKYKENENFEIYADNFKKCALGKMLKKQTKDFKFEIGKVFKDDKKDFVITDREYRQREGFSKGKSYTINDKLYKYKCNKCGFECGECYKKGEYLNEYWIPENTILKGHGCPVCSANPMIIAPNINSIYNTDSWMIKLGVKEEDAKRYSKSSGVKIEVTCPICNATKITTVNKIYNRGTISCTNCSDNIKYPEKFMANTLKELNVEFIQQLSIKDFKWIGDRRYDFYIPKYNMIIETHGKQHYEKVGGFYKTLEEEQENDRVKKKLALNNSIDKYVIIDCRKSEVEWIKNSILNSELSEMFDLSDINWENIGLLSLSSNIIKEVCEYWNNKEDWETTRHLAEYFDLNQGVIISYLNKGTNLNLCNYNPYEQTLKTAYNIAGHNKKSVEIFKNEISLGVFESCSELERQSEKLFGVKLLHGSISEVCNSKKLQYKGFTFKYIENID